MNESTSSKGSDSPLTKQIIRPVNGTCDACGKENCLVQKSLVTEHPDGYMDRTYGTPEYFEDHRNIESRNTCKVCFVIPDEDFEWDEDGDYPDLNQRNTIWCSGNWKAEVKPL